MAARIKIHPGLDVPEERIREYVASFQLPGEQARVSRSVKFAGESDADAEARRRAVGEGPLTVSELRLDRTEEGMRLNYRFEGVDGLHNAKGFENAEGFEQSYGALIHRDGETWFVPFEGKLEEPVAGEAMRVAPVMNRCGHYHFGLPDETLAEFGHKGAEGLTVEAFLAEHEAEPTAGEYALSPLGDGTWRLDASPWMSSASDKEIALAEGAIEAARAAPGPR